MTQANPKVLLADIKVQFAGPTDTLERRLLDALAGFTPRIVDAARPYWKIPQWHECTLELDPADRGGFDAVIALTKECWQLMTNDEEEGGECEGVWNPAPGHIFLLPEVTWAHVLLVTPNPPTPEMEFLQL